MPQAPYRDTGQRNTQLGRPNVAATADDFGAGATRRGGAALAGGIDAGAAAIVRVDHAVSEADALDLENQFSAFTREQLYGPEGYLSAQGRHALERREAVETALRERVSEIEARAGNGRSADMFRRAAQARLDDALGTVVRHYGQQAEVYRAQAIEARIGEAADNAVAAWADPDLVGANINTIIGEVERAAMLGGWAPETRDATIKARTSSAWAGVITRMADADASMAAEVFERQRGSMTAGDVSAVMERLSGRLLAQRARTQVGELMTAAGGSAQRFFSLADDIDDTELRDEVVSRGMQMLREREAAETADAENAQERALAAIARGGPDAVSSGDRALLVREGRWGAIMDAAAPDDTESDRLADRLEALAVESPEGFRIATQIIRGGRVAEDVSDEDIRRATDFSRAELEGMRPRLLGDDWKRVLDRANDQTDPRQLDRVYKAIRDQAAPLALSQGVVITGRGEDIVRRRGQFDAFIMAEARAHMAEHAGRMPTQAEIDAIASRALIREQGGFSLFGAEVGRPTTRAFEAREDRRVRVRWTDIPQADQAGLVAQWRAAHPDAEPDEAAIRRWSEQVYADSLQRY